MRAFIVEDDPFKLSRLRGEITGFAGVTHVASATSLQEAMSILESEQFDVVLLDMAIPSHAGTAGSADVYSQPVGGLDILLYLAFNERPEKIIILTQYPTVEYNREHVALNKLSAKLEAEGIDNVSGVILFDEREAWRKNMKDIVGNLR